MNQNKLPLFILIFSIIYVLTLVYFSIQIKALKNQKVVTIPILPTEVPTKLPTQVIQPTTTTKPSSIVSLKYTLPSGWSEVRLSNSRLSIGYDPATMNINQNNSDGLFIRYNTTLSYADFVAQEKNYDGGSRHNFIYNIIGSNNLQDRLPGYHEKEYKIDGITCLFLIGIQPSQSLPTWGICPISNSKAFFINMLVLDDGSIEKMLRTVKFN